MDDATNETANEATIAPTVGSAIVATDQGTHKCAIDATNVNAVSTTDRAANQSTDMSTVVESYASTLVTTNSPTVRCTQRSSLFSTVCLPIIAAFNSTVTATVWNAFGLTIGCLVDKPSPVVSTVRETYAVPIASADRSALAPSSAHAQLSHSSTAEPIFFTPVTATGRLSQFSAHSSAIVATFVPTVNCSDESTDSPAERSAGTAAYASTKWPIRMAARASAIRSTVRTANDAVQSSAVGTVQSSTDGVSDDYAIESSIEPVVISFDYPANDAADTAPYVSAE